MEQEKIELPKKEEEQKKEEIPYSCHYCGDTREPVSDHPGYDGYPYCPGCGAV